jgi:hypothetical protein
LDVNWVQKSKNKLFGTIPNIVIHKLSTGTVIHGGFGGPGTVIHGGFEKINF